MLQKKINLKKCTMIERLFKIFRVLQLNFFIVYVFFFITFFVGVGIFNDYLQNPISHKNEKKEGKDSLWTRTNQFWKENAYLSFQKYRKALM